VYRVRAIAVSNFGVYMGGSLELWSGVPQGTVQRPLLFLIYINDLEDDVVFKFTDDTKLFRQAKDTVDTFGMQADLDQVS